MTQNILFAIGQLVEVWWSSERDPKDETWYKGPKNIKYKLDRQPDLTGTYPDEEPITKININPTITYQTIQGIGTSLEESTVYNLSRMSAAKREEVLRALVDPVNGIGMNLIRLCFGTSDFTGREWYSYDDMPESEKDPDLIHFSIQKDIDYNIISVIKEALSYNPDLKFIASPWSPPGWVKTGLNSLCGGRINPVYFPVTAKYYSKAIQSYEEQGIPIYAFTIQNEPGVNRADMPSCSFTWQEERNFVQTVKTEFLNNDISTKVLILDHNFDMAMNYAGKILADARAHVTTDGIAFHDYTGEPSEMTMLHNSYPDKELFLTERSVWGTSGMDRIIQYFRNWSCTYNAWVTMLDSNRLPNNGPFDPDPTLVIQDADNFNNYWFIPEYYMIGQFAKFIQRGAKRIKSDYGSPSTITCVAFLNPDNTIVLIAVNQTSSNQKFKVLTEVGQITTTIPAGTMATYRWS